MLHKLFIFYKFKNLVYCLAISTLGLFCPVSLVWGQVGEVEEAPAVPEEEFGEEPTEYHWSKENAYYEESVKPREFDEASWKRAIEGLDYTSKAKPSKKKEPKKAKDTPDLPSLEGANVFFSWLFKGLLIAAGLVAIVLIVRSLILVKMAPKDLAFQPQGVEKLDLQHLEENLNTADLDPFLQRAIEQENYTLAVRLYYLSVLKKLSQQKLVFWKKDKTNRDYLRELNATKFHQPFQHTTRAFEWVWYGDVALGKQDFERLQAQFKDMLLLIQQNNRPS